MQNICPIRVETFLDRFIFFIKTDLCKESLYFNGTTYTNKYSQICNNLLQDKNLEFKVIINCMSVLALSMLK